MRKLCGNAVSVKGMKWLDPPATSTMWPPVHRHPGGSQRSNPPPPIRFFRTYTVASSPHFLLRYVTTLRGCCRSSSKYLVGHRLSPPTPKQIQIDQTPFKIRNWDPPSKTYSINLMQAYRPALICVIFYGPHIFEARLIMQNTSNIMSITSALLMKFLNVCRIIGPHGAPWRCLVGTQTV